MLENTQTAKRTLREQIRASLNRMSAQQRAAGSARARARLKEQIPWSSAKSVLFFASLPREVDVWPLVIEGLRDAKQVFLPRSVPASGDYEVCQIQDPQADLQTGSFGIREPGIHCTRSALGAMDLILVPGLAFDLRGRRLGRGKGHYDRLLSALRGITCGVAFEEQLVAEIPVEAHDIRLNYVLTPDRWIEVKG